MNVCKVIDCVNIFEHLIFFLLNLHFYNKETKYVLCVISKWEITGKQSNSWQQIKAAKVVQNNLITLKPHSKKTRTKTPPQRTEFVHWFINFTLHSKSQWSLCNDHRSQSPNRIPMGSQVTRTRVVMHFVPIRDCLLLVQSIFSAAGRPQKGPQRLGNNPSFSSLSRTKIQSLETMTQQRPMTYAIHSYSQFIVTCHYVQFIA